MSFLVKHRLAAGLALGVAMVSGCTSAPSATGPSASPSPSAVPAPAVKTTVATPKTLGGRTLVGAPDIFGDPVNFGVTDAVSAVYQTEGPSDTLAASAMATTKGTRQERLDFFKNTVTSQFNGKNFTTVAPGPFGGQAECGEASEDDTEVSVCIWSDTTTAGAIIAYREGAQDLPSIFVQLRGEIEKPV